MGFSKNPLLDVYNPRWLRYAILKIDMTSFFSAKGGPIWIKFRRLVQNDMSTAVMCGNENQMADVCKSSQSHVSHCRVLPLGEFTVTVTTSHIAGCSHLTKSMSWSCHIAGCKNSIRHIENRFSPYFIFLFLMQFRRWQAVAFVSSPIHLLCTI